MSLEKTLELTLSIEVGETLLLRNLRKKRGLESKETQKVLVLSVYKTERKARVQVINTGKIVYAYFASLHPLGSLQK